MKAPMFLTKSDNHPLVKHVSMALVLAGMAPRLAAPHVFQQVTLASSLGSLLGWLVLESLFQIVFVRLAGRSLGKEKKKPRTPGPAACTGERSVLGQLQADLSALPC
eukprot:1154651-Pelagomonas_calceolata.AAC.3